MVARQGIWATPSVKEEEANRRMFRLAQDGRTPEEGALSRGVQSALGFYSRLRRLQSGAHAKSGRRSPSGVSRSRSLPGDPQSSDLEIPNYSNPAL